jgi:CDP-6-deoxy-D-xylo-4-hexulose-3-dehydrase
MAGFNIGDIVVFRGAGGEEFKGVVVDSDSSELTLVRLYALKQDIEGEFTEVVEESDMLDGGLTGRHILKLKKLNIAEKRFCEKKASLKRGKIESVLRKLCKVFPEVYYNMFHRQKVFIPGNTWINYSGRVYDRQEILNLMDATLDFWLTAGPFARELERRMCELFGARAFFLVNSGSSANLILMSAIRSVRFKGRLKPGDEVITPAVTFPTTLSPIIQNQLVPVFVDCEVGTYNIDPAKIEDAVGPRTRAIFVPHTLGNPCNMDIIMDVVKRKNLILLEDSCDALGAMYDGKLVGTFGIMASLSFYPPHHMTMGEGGGVVINDSGFIKTALSLRDWGRDCWCEPGQSNTCGRRFDMKRGDLPLGYDHKYVYSNMGYNFKVTDMQAAVGLAQMEKLKGFVAARRNNFRFFYDELKRYEDYLILPRWEKKADPSWFGFTVTLRDTTLTNNLIRHLESAMIETRKAFAGNILKQPGFKNIEHRVHGTLEQTDKIMRDTFFFGVYPGLTEQMKEYIVEQFRRFFSR